MWCPDGFFLIREVFNECQDIASEAAETPPPWLERLGDVDLAVEEALKSLSGKCVRPDIEFALPRFYDDEFSSTEDKWPDIYAQALCHWLLARFLKEEKYNLFLVPKSGDCVRISSETALFVLGPGETIFHASNFFFDEPSVIAMLAIGGPPFNLRFQFPAYILNEKPAPTEPNNVYDIESQQLAPFRGSPLAWKARPGETPCTVVMKILSELTLFSSYHESSGSQRTEDSAKNLQVVWHDIRQAFPKGKGSSTWEAVERKSGHSRRNIVRALTKFDGQEWWAEAGQ